MFLVRVEFSFKDAENLDTEKDYYNDLPGKLPPELLGSDLPQKVSQLTIQVRRFSRHIAESANSFELSIAETERTIEQQFNRFK